MIGNRKWKVSSTQANSKGLKTTVTISTDDETIVRKILQEPTAQYTKDNNSKKDDPMNTKAKSTSSKKQIKQLAAPTKPTKQQKNTKKKMNRNTSTRNGSKKSTVNNNTSNKTSETKKPTQPAENNELYYGRFLIHQKPGISWDLIDTIDPNYNPFKKNSGVICSIYDFGTLPLSKVVREFDKRMKEELKK